MAIELPETEDFSFDSDVEIISDERGVRIARSDEPPDCRRIQPINSFSSIVTSKFNRMERLSKFAVPMAAVSSSTSMTF